MGSCSSSEAAASHAPAGARGGAQNGKFGKPLILDKTSDVRAVYKFDRVLGNGTFGIVHLVTDRKTGKEFACKSIDKKKLATQEQIEDVKREIQILQHLGGHVNVVQLYGCYEDKTYIHLVMECCQGGELFDRIAKLGHLSEKMAAEQMRTVVSVVHHCHTMNVIHRDLKPENFLLSSKGSDCVLKATDFGLSRFFEEDKSMDDIVGSPFYGRNPAAIFQNILSANLDLKSSPWDKISEPAKDCVKSMLQRNPQKRLTAKQVLQHPWMKENGIAIEEPMVPEVLARLRKFTHMNNLKKEALKSLPAPEIEGILQMFHAIDKDGSGSITVDELRAGLLTKGAELAIKEVEAIVNKIDINGDHNIDYEEFLAATIHVNKLAKEEVMLSTFKYFDKDGSGYITKDEIAVALDQMGELGDVDMIIRDVDANNDGMIDYAEFCVMMRSNQIGSQFGDQAAFVEGISKRGKPKVSASGSDLSKLSNLSQTLPFNPAMAALKGIPEEATPTAAPSSLEAGHSRVATADDDVASLLAPAQAGGTGARDSPATQNDVSRCSADGLEAHPTAPQQEELAGAVYLDTSQHADHLNGSTSSSVTPESDSGSSAHDGQVVTVGMGTFQEGARLGGSTSSSVTPESDSGSSAHDGQVVTVGLGTSQEGARLSGSTSSSTTPESDSSSSSSAHDVRSNASSNSPV
eukprot:gene30782-35822_t